MKKFLPALLLLSSQAHALTAKELYFRCMENESTFSTCVSQELQKDKSGLRKNFEDKLAKQQDFLRSKDSRLLSNSCQTTHLNFKRDGKANRWAIEKCGKEGDCQLLSQEVGLLVDESQKNEILSEFSTFTKSKNIFGVEVQEMHPEKDALPKSCATKGAQCFLLFQKFLGYPPTSDMSYGVQGLKVETINPAPNQNIFANEASKGPRFHLQINVTFIFPSKTLQSRLPSLFSQRKTSLLAKVFDKASSEAEMQTWVFNIQLLNLLQKRISQGNGSFSFSFFKENGICADEIYQINRARRGMNIYEALLFRTKDESHDLTHTVGGALKNVGNGFTQVVTGFVKEQTKNIQSAD